MNIVSFFGGNQRRIKKLAMREAELAAVQNRYRKFVAANDRRQRVANAFYNYNTGGTTLTSGEKWNDGLSNNGITRIFDHLTIRRNARDAMYDSPQARAIATRFSDSIVDVGLKARFEPNADALGMTSEEAVEWGRKRSQEYHSYMLSKDSSVDGVNNGYQNQRLYGLMQQRENEIYCRFRYRRRSELISPLQIQFLDADQVCGRGYTSTNGLIQGMDTGIEYDSDGRETAYNFLVYDSKEKRFTDVKIPVRGKKSGRLYAIHGFRREYPGQKMGYSLFSHLLQEFEDLTTLQTAHIQKAINQSSFGFYTKPSKDAPASQGMDDFANSSSSAVDDFLAKIGADEIDGMNADQLSTLTFNIMKEVQIRKPGTIYAAHLNRGEDMKAVEHTAPADKFPEFVHSLIMNMSASSGMPVEVLLMKFGQNYSASRATLVLFWRIVNIWRSEMQADFLDPWATAWLTEEIASGRVRAPGWSDPRMRAAWCNIRWVGTSVPTIDPKREADADMIRAIMSHETLDDGALRYNGSDGQRNREANARQFEQLPASPFSNSKSESSSEKDDEEDDDEDNKQ